MEARGYALRTAIYFGAVFAIVGLYVPYFPVWLDTHGFTAAEISIIIGAPLFARVVFTPYISFLADRIANYRLMLMALSLGTLLCVLALHGAIGYLAVLLISLLFAVFWYTVMPLTETIALTGVRRSGLDYGRMRLWGSISFIIASFGGGIAIATAGGASVLWLLTAASALLVLCSYFLPRQNPELDVESGGLSKSSADHRPTIQFTDALALARTPLFLLFVLATSAIQAGHAVYYTFGTLHWQSQGLSGTVIGILWAIGVLAEIILFAWSGRAAARVGPIGLIVLGGLATIVRWAVTAMDPPLGVLMPLQILHGLTFGATHLGAVLFIARAFPAELGATAQGVYATMSSGLGMGLAIALAGPLYAAVAGQAYLAMSGLGLVGTIAALLLMRGWQGGEITKPPGT